jgi:hypothetical protein
VDFGAIVGVLIAQQSNRHREEGLCFKCHKKGIRVF